MYGTVWGGLACPCAGPSPFCDTLFPAATGMTSKQQLDSFIDKFTPEMAAQTRWAFAWMRRRFPAATVLVYDNYNALAIGFGPSEKTSDAVFSLAVFPQWVSLFFLQGAALPDPHRRLTGGGKQARHIKLEPLELLEDPQVLSLMDAETARLGLSNCSGRGKIVIKSISAKQRPRRPAAAGMRR